MIAGSRSSNERDPSRHARTTGAAGVIVTEMPVLFPLTRLLVDVDDAIRVRIGNRVQQQRAHDAEHRGRRADSQRERDHGDGGPHLLSSERAEREADILQEVADEFGSLHLSLAVARGVEEPRSGFVERTELADRFVIGVVRRWRRAPSVVRRAA